MEEMVECRAMPLAVVGGVPDAEALALGINQARGIFLKSSHYRERIIPKSLVIFGVPTPPQRAALFSERGGSNHNAVTHALLDTFPLTLYWFCWVRVYYRVIIIEWCRRCWTNWTRHRTGRLWRPACNPSAAPPSSASVLVRCLLKSEP